MKKNTIPPIYTLILSSLLFLVIGCAPASEESADTESEAAPAVEGFNSGLSAEEREAIELRAVEREVMKVHDEVMPRMGDINNTRKKLLALAEEVDAEKTLAQINTSVIALEEADSLMWEWMHNYNRPSYDGDLDSVRTFLENEQKRIETVRDKMTSSLENGEALIEKLKNENE